MPASPYPVVSPNMLQTLRLEEFARAEEAYLHHRLHCDSCHGTHYTQSGCVKAAHAHGQKPELVITRSGNFSPHALLGVSDPSLLVITATGLATPDEIRNNGYAQFGFGAAEYARYVLKAEHFLVFASPWSLHARQLVSGYHALPQCFRPETNTDVLSRSIQAAQKAGKTFSEMSLEDQIGLVSMEVARRRALTQAEIIKHPVKAAYINFDTRELWIIDPGKSLADNFFGAACERHGLPGIGSLEGTSPYIYTSCIDARAQRIDLLNQHVRASFWTKLGGMIHPAKEAIALGPFNIWQQFFPNIPAFSWNGNSNPLVTSTHHPCGKLGALRDYVLGRTVFTGEFFGRLYRTSMAALVKELVESSFYKSLNPPQADLVLAAAVAKQSGINVLQGLDRPVVALVKDNATQVHRLVDLNEKDPEALLHSPYIVLPRSDIRCSTLGESCPPRPDGTPRSPEPGRQTIQAIQASRLAFSPGQQLVY